MFLVPKEFGLARQYWKCRLMSILSLLSSLAESTKKGSCQVFQNFMGKTDSRPMPHFDMTSWCESTCIYWLKSEEDDSGESMIEQGVRSMKLEER